MLLLLVRHALAAERDEIRFPLDRERPLLPKGKKIQTRVSRRLARRGCAPSVIFASPWKRAWQTAGILARETGAAKDRRLACPALAADPDLDTLAAAVGPRGLDEVVALVGHEPWISELASLLLTGSPNGLAIRFEKSAVMGIEAQAIAAAAGRLVFFAPPRAPA